MVADAVSDYDHFDSMNCISRSTVAVLATLVIVTIQSADAQNLDVTFRYVPQPSDNFVRIFTPGEFNNWGNNTTGMIAPTDGSLMSFDPPLGEWLYTTSLPIGSTQSYKFHYHLNTSGTSYLWFNDPNNPRIDTGDFNNSLVTITDPMIFEPARKLNEDGRVAVVSAGIFGTQNITALTFEINGVEQEGLASLDTATGIFKYTLSTPAPAGSQFKITATDALARVVSDSVGVSPPDVTDEPLPPGSRDGINYDDADPTSVTLSLLAPGKNYVYVIGEFNDWETDDAYLMKRDSVNADSVRFWLTLPPVTPGQEYAFQYLVDGQIRMADLYSPKILDPFNDGSIGSVYPGLKPYPTGQTSQMVSTFQTNQAPYNWQTVDYERPPQGELVIYEMIIRDFLADHSFATMIDTLDYLQNLGINAIELMPVSEFEGNLSWGYNPMFHLALDKYYGPADKLKELVDAAHARGIAVILDVVYNHATGQSPLVRMYNASATGTPGAPPLDSNPYVNVVAKHPFNVFHDVNHESTLTKYWLDRANEYWLTEFNVDGFRFDLSKGFTQVDYGNDVGAWGGYDASRIALLSRMADKIWSVDSTAYIILEHFGGNTEEMELAEYGMSEGYPGMMLWNNLNHQYNEATMGYGSNLSNTYYGNRGWDVPHLISYMESHDEQWLMFKNISFGACTNGPGGGGICDTNPGEYNVRDWGAAFDRMKMAGAFFLTVPGPRMIWQFGELGYGYGPDGRECLQPGDGSLGDCPTGTPGRVGNKPIRWEYFSDPLRLKLYKSWAAMLRLRKEHEVFRSTDTQVSMDVAGSAKSITLDSPSSMDAMMVGNFAVSSRSYSPSFLYTGTWYDFFTGDSLEVTDVNMTMDLLPGEFHIYTSEKVFTPESDLITVDVDDEVRPISVDLEIQSIYPNPASYDLTYSIQIPQAGLAAVEIYDVLGRKVLGVAHVASAPGSHSNQIDVSTLPAGAYFLRATSAGQATVHSFIISR